MVYRINTKKRISNNCDIEPDAALGVAVLSVCNKLNTTCRRKSRWLSGFSSTKQSKAPRFCFISCLSGNITVSAPLLRYGRISFSIQITLPADHNC
ncbi:hypothetical protein T4A_1787 [Trichinella pseudospiralis]|uniref:Uncharacterized protein n=1 Tax=Trichinella pseudospiralis TaxID=6337 RepID=A0A0V1DX56_TRIPS|nr:hypothetical protein T4A_1787 [Trichinella pseudospiralis]